MADGAEERGAAGAEFVSYQRNAGAVLVGAVSGELVAGPGMGLGPGALGLGGWTKWELAKGAVTAARVRSGRRLSASATTLFLPRRCLNVRSKSLSARNCSQLACFAVNDVWDRRNARLWWPVCTVVARPWR